ncbi:hypothetical protein SPI_06423 [Niveomyces insectorum RCEF 264]|uniref:Uncharacterized protein n=1 Tax=Niveomyces insectorum RCEF 264 TaxID=1081102 RepID=A0A167S4C3_9HYPO|nr:hypothetical protein SPI_06423 [Niveomyces insectorum RCEF 264]
MDMSVVEMDDTAAATAAAATVAAERGPTPDTDASAEAPPACRSRSAGTTNGKARVD